MSDAPEEGSARTQAVSRIASGAQLACEVMLVRETGSPVQLHAWRRLWDLLLRGADGLGQEPPNPQPPGGCAGAMGGARRLAVSEGGEDSGEGDVDDQGGSEG
jgi:hypothetical protein